LSTEDIIEVTMARLVRMGAENTYVISDNEVFPIEEALRDRSIDIVDIIEENKPLAFHFSNPPTNNYENAISINPIEMKIMSTSEFMNEDISKKKVLNFVAMLRCQRTYDRITSIISLIYRSAREIGEF
jgi:hypothetical protein